MKFRLILSPPINLLMNNQHIFREFDKVIEVLKADVLSMACLTRQNLERAMRALLERDIDLARAVIADEVFGESGGKFGSGVFSGVNGTHDKGFGFCTSDVLIG